MRSFSKIYTCTQTFCTHHCGASVPWQRRLHFSFIDWESDLKIKIIAAAVGMGDGMQCYSFFCFIWWFSSVKYHLGVKLEDHNNNNNGMQYLLHFNIQLSLGYRCRYQEW